MYKKEYSFLKEVDSLALANVQLHLEKAYKNFFRDMFSFIWRKHIRIFSVIPRLDFHVSSQNITPKTATQQM